MRRYFLGFGGKMVDNWNCNLAELAGNETGDDVVCGNAFPVPSAVPPPKPQNAPWMRLVFGATHILHLPKLQSKYLIRFMPQLSRKCGAVCELNKYK